MLKIYAVGNNLSHLLLVDGLRVINGEYDCKKNKDGTISPICCNQDSKAYYVMDVPQKYHAVCWDEKRRIYPALEWAEEKLKKQAEKK